MLNFFTQCFFHRPNPDLYLYSELDSYHTTDAGFSIYSEPNQQLVCEDTECERSHNHVARDLYRTIQKIYDFYLKRFGLNGIDGKGSVPSASIDWFEEQAQSSCYKEQANMRCWLTFHNKYAVNPDVVAHEYTHAIIDSFTKLDHSGEPGSLHESIADVFAIIFKHWTAGHETNWGVGGLRDASKPIDMRFFKHAKEYRFENDYGYVHHNSKIPTHAFYRAVKISQTSSTGDIAQIWFRAMLNFTPNENFVIFARRTQIFSRVMNKPKATSAITKAWLDVGVLKISIPRQPRPFNSLPRPIHTNDCITHELAQKYYW